MSHSHALYSRAVKAVPGGVHSSSRARSPYPQYFKSGAGAYLYDADDNPYIDLILGNGAIFFGHGYRPFLEKYQANLARFPGLTTGVETELAIEAAERFLEIIPAQQVRFANTGTEAVLHAMQMARAHTRKNDFALVEGAYNGWADTVNISNFPSLEAAGEPGRPNAVAGAGGLDCRALSSAVIVPFNDLEATRHLLTQHQGRLAGLILEPVMIDVGFIEPDAGYLSALRTLCDELDMLLIFDELLSGFRMPGGSCHRWLGVEPDLSVFGKAIANGHILAAVAGRQHVMETVASRGLTNFVGTFNGHVYSMAAALAALDLMADGSARETLDRRVGYLKDRFEARARALGIPAVLHGRGGHMHWYFTDTVRNYRDAAGGDTARYIAFSQAMLDQGMLVIPKPLSHHAISLSHDDTIIEKIAAAMEHALNKVAGR